MLTVGSVMSSPTLSSSEVEIVIVTTSCSFARVPELKVLLLATLTVLNTGLVLS